MRPQRREAAARYGTIAVTCAVASGTECPAGWGDAGAVRMASSRYHQTLLTRTRRDLQISSGWYHMAAIVQGGGVVVWGRGDHGQLGASH